MPGGESFLEVQSRAIDTLERITQLYPPKTTLLISSHNFVNLTILCYAFGKSLDSFREFVLNSSFLRRFDVEEEVVTQIRDDDEDDRREHR